ncbi:transcription antiterminator BglG [Bifidobacterium lemurum]|uniref:Transcription antiterminator BglG n=1 Tax=Bifidobacterium lemurum TaxID=1603886 RepID=A0A261FVJ0_9BIFI|nr:PRD domain-containing protein [Bifidobacterium lemurum]OZG63148.1 transcription antiterminator BglG [Bifidobacterium lemurum]QOL33476.1 PRD domain-containing protein [Bifidobacterium lemurum]
MKILRVFNNNVVLAQGRDGEVILTGRGIGFQARPGMRVDESKVVRTFVPADGRDPDHMAQLLSDIRPETIRAVCEAMGEAGLDADMQGSATLVMAVADHVDNALLRLERGIEVDYPLVGEVSNLYPKEYEQGRLLVRALNRRLDRALPQGEAIALALHLVNAGFSTGDLTYTYQMTGVIQQIITIIEETYEVELDRSSVNVGRFITHLRYLFVRINQHRQLVDEPESIVGAIRDSYAKAVRCASYIATVLELRFDADITEDEIAYLALHVARVADNGRHGRSVGLQD